MRSIRRCMIRLMVATSLLMAGVAQIHAQGSLEMISPDLTFGVADGRQEEMFGTVTQIAVDASERVYVVDPLVRTVRVFASSGAYERSIGTRGFGPGEFQAPTYLAFGNDGTVVVRDLELQRMVVFDGRGVPVAAWQARNQEAYWDPLRSDEAGNVYVGVRTWSDSTTPHRIVKFDPVDGPSTADTIPIPRTTLDAIYGGAYGYLATQPFAAMPSWDVAPDGTVWFSEGHEAVLERRDGSSISFQQIEARRVRIDPATSDSARSAVAEVIRAKVPPGTDQERAIAQIEVPDYHPEVLGLMVDRQSRLWVRRPSTTAGVAVVFDVLSPDGVEVGRLGLLAPADRRLDLRWMAVGREGIYIASLDRLDIYRVERYPIPETLR